MLGPTLSALSGLNNAVKRIQNSANNLANVTTSGFKKGKVNSIENKSGVTQVNSISKINTQGGLIPTNNPLDLAIKGNGFHIFRLRFRPFFFRSDGRRKKKSEQKSSPKNSCRKKNPLKLFAKNCFAEKNIESSIIFSGGDRWRRFRCF